MADGTAQPRKSPGPGSPLEAEVTVGPGREE